MAEFETLRYEVADGILTIVAMGFLTYLGASAGPPQEINITPPQNVVAQGPTAVSTFLKGQQVVAQSGCGACHKFGENGNDGPGPNLTKIGARLPAQAIERTLNNPTAPMPSFRNMPPAQKQALVGFLGQLR